MNLHYLIFEHLASKLPLSNSRFNIGQKKFRAWLAKHFCTIGMNVNLEKGASIPLEMVIGNNSGIGVNCMVQGPIEIGNDVMMGPEVLIFTTNHGFRDKSKCMIQQGHEAPKKVVIGDDVWIGQRVIILPGTTIPNGVVCGAGAVISSKCVIEPYSIVAGNPAKIIGYRK